MTLTVFYKSGTERSFKNVRNIVTQVSFIDGTPRYEISFYKIGERKALNLHEIKNFEILDRPASFIFKNGAWHCPYCERRLPTLVKEEIDTYDWCPYCGRRVE